MTQMIHPEQLQALSDEALSERVEAGLNEGAFAIATVGIALKEIRRRKAYPTTFEDFVTNEFGMTRSRAYQLIYASEILADLIDTFDKKQLPKSDSAVLPMMKLNKEQRIEVWRRALKESKRSPGQGTVKRLVKELYGVA